VRGVSPLTPASLSMFIVLSMSVDRELIKSPITRVNCLYGKSNAGIGGFFMFSPQIRVGHSIFGVLLLEAGGLYSLPAL